jgi:NAD(P)-dependent dehydrogenase (short-subunit alcohol dehydrogenase family)
MVAAVVERFGRLDCAHNNAGVSSPPLATIDMTLDEWNRMLSVNLTGVFLCVREELKVMVPQRSGAIVNTSSGAGVVPAPGRPHYTAAKHGVLGLTKVVAKEHAADGIRVNAVLPGIIHTPMIEASFGDDQAVWQGVAASVPSGRLGRPEEVAQAAVWLCSPRASYVNGESMAVDGATVTR